MLYEVRVTANKGLGLFATQNIPRGTRIVAEEPLIALQPGQRPSDVLGYAKELNEESRKRLLGLSWHHGNGIKRLGRWSEALGWMVWDRATNAKGGQIQRNGTEKISGIVLGRLKENLNIWREAVRILSIFRSNSFNLAASASWPLDARSSGPSSSTGLGVPEAPMNHERSASDLKTTPSPTSAIELALFPAIARINHSCDPNAQANYHPLNRTFNIHATKDIPAGEEVSINYLPEHGQLRAQRVAKLEDSYGFTCNCPACDLDTEEGQQGERSRKYMQDRLKTTRALFTDSTAVAVSGDAGYGADGMPESLPCTATEEVQRQMDTLRLMSEQDRKVWLRDRELEVLNTMLAMYQAEGIVGHEVASMYLNIARLQQSTGLENEAMASAEAGLKLEEACLGTDHPAYLEALALVESMRNVAVGARSASPQRN